VYGSQTTKEAYEERIRDLNAQYPKPRSNIQEFAVRALSMDAKVDHVFGVSFPLRFRHELLELDYLVEHHPYRWWWKLVDWFWPGYRFERLYGYYEHLLTKYQADRWINTP
jgi:hypothetical protein